MCQKCVGNVSKMCRKCVGNVGGDRLITGGDGYEKGAFLPTSLAYETDSDRVSVSQLGYSSAFSGLSHLSALSGSGSINSFIDYDY